MLDRLKALTQQAWVAHILRSNLRFTNRLGAQFAAAITYFSVLSMIPVLALAFALTGMVIEFAHLQQPVLQAVQGALSELPPDLSKTLSTMVLDWLTHWGGSLTIGSIGGLYTGISWVANIKSAVRSQFRPAFDEKEKKRGFLAEMGVNLGLLIVLLLLFGLTMVLSTAATSMTRTIVGLLDLDTVPGMTLLFRVAPLVASLAAGFGLFFFIFRVMPEHQPARPALLKGAAIAAVGLMLLQALMGVIMGLFAKNQAAAIFGNVIVLMLFFNLFAQLILRVSSWIATYDQPAVANEWNDADRPLIEDDGITINAPESHAARAGLDRARQEVRAAGREVTAAHTALEKGKGSEDDLAAARTRLALACDHLAELEAADECPPAAASAPASVDPSTPATVDLEGRRRARSSLFLGWLAGVGSGAGAVALAVAALLRRR